MKKLLLTLGALSAVVAPVAAVVACGTTTTESNNNEGAAATTKAPATTQAPAATQAPATTGTAAATTTQAPATDGHATVDQLVHATAEQLIGGLTAEGKALTHYYVVVGKDDKGFDIRTCFLNSKTGQNADYTNRLVLNAADKGAHDYVLTAGYDATQIEVGDVITEEINADHPVMSQATSYKTYGYGLVKNAEVSFQA